VSRPSCSERVLDSLAVLAGLAGLVISTYLTVVHFSAVPLVCSAGGSIDCGRVLSSPYSVIAGSGLPTSAAGIVWFGVSAALAATPLVGRGSPLMTKAQLGWAVIGLATVLYLLFVEIVLLGVICIWCTGSHALVVLTFVLALTRAQLIGQARASD